MKNTSNRAVAYVRVSTRPQEEKFSPDIQRKAITAYADKHDLNIVKSFEEARSGWRLKARVDFYEMLDFIKEQKIRNVVYYLTSRISRNIEDWQDLKKAATILHNVSRGVSFDLNNKLDWRSFIEEERELVEAKRFSYQNSESASQGMKASAERGDYPGPIPIGYMAQYKRDRKRKIVLDPESGPLIKKLFVLYGSDEYNLRQITRKMRDLGLRSSRKGNPVTLPCVFRILHNPFYYGLFRWAGRLYQGNYDPIVSKSLFDEVQQVLEGKTNHSGKHGKDFKYKGLLKCGICGHTVLGEEKIKKFKKTGEKRYVYYHCAQSKDKCQHPTYTETEMDEFFELAISDLWWTEEAYELVRKNLEIDYHAREEIVKEEISALKKELAEVKIKIDRGLDLLLSGKISPELLNEKHNSLKIRQAEIEGRMSELAQEKAQKIEKIFDSLELTKDLKTKYLQASPEIREKLAKLMYITVFVNPRKSRVAGRETRQPLDIIWNEPFASIFGDSISFAEQEEDEEEEEKRAKMKDKRAWRDSNSRPAA